MPDFSPKRVYLSSISTTGPLAFEQMSDRKERLPADQVAAANSRELCVRNS